MGILREQDTVQRVVGYLLSEQKGRIRGSSGWVDHYCLFHDDGHNRGASFHPDTKAYVCRHGGQYTFDDVLAKIGVVKRVGYGKQVGDPAHQRELGEKAAADLLDLSPKSQPPKATRVAEDTSILSSVFPASSNTPTSASVSPTNASAGRSAEGTSSAAQFREFRPKESSPEPKENGLALQDDLVGQPAKDEPAETISLPERKRYTYFWPESGEISHYMERRQYEDHKEFAWIHPDGLTAGKPDDIHPVYGDGRLQHGCYIIVVEGEKCVDAIHDANDSLEAPIVGVTWPSGTSSAEKYSPALVHRLDELDPKLVILWPDNDAPGTQAMLKIARQLKLQGIQYVWVKPKEHGWPPKYDVADYLAKQESLAAIIDEVRAQLPTAGIDEFVAGMICAENDAFVFPGTRQLRPIRQEYIKALWHEKYGRVPRNMQVEDILARLRQRSIKNPTPTAYRMTARSDRFFWRASSVGNCYQISADGIVQVPDPVDMMLVLHKVNNLFSPDVDLEGTKEDFLALGEKFKLTPLDMAVLEGWLVCAFCGLQTPIMMMRGRAETGKTAFARAVISIVDPIAMELDASRIKHRDQREFVRALQMGVAVLLDNVSTLPYDVEDTLSKLVTGYTVPLRVMYEDRVDVVRLKKAVVMTTITYDVFKSDLVSRMIVVTPSYGDKALRKAERLIYEWINTIMPRVRGYIFNRCQEFYRQREEFKEESVSFRGDMGWVLRSLGYPADELAGQEAANKALIVNQNDALLDALVEIWETDCEQLFSYKVSSTKLCDRVGKIMETEGIDPRQIPKPSGQRMRRYIEEKQEMFKNFGFEIELYRDKYMRGYEFKAIV